MGGKSTSPEEDDFEVSGPKHMKSKASASKITVDWNNSEHRRCVTACLVKATCVMENDRINSIKCRDEELARPWFESFGFRLKKKIKNDSKENDQFTFGAIFERIASFDPSAPKYVVAFRGTMLSHPKAMDELLQDGLVVFNAVAQNKRFERTRLDIDSLKRERDLGNGSNSIWLAGHSLGASLALEIGRRMMSEEGRNIPTFLFNPPHVSPAKVIDELLTEKETTWLYAGSYAVKFVLAQLVSGQRQRTKQLFEQLAPWVPELYVNPKDCICMGYIQYFLQRQMVAKVHPILPAAARMSYRDMFFSMFGDKKLQPHLLPSASLWKSSSQGMDAHALRQWWKSDIELAPTNTRYSYPHNASA